MRPLRDRTRLVLTGLITLSLFTAVSVFAVRWANGALEPRYQLLGSFAAAGQGLQPESDVKIRGVDVGRVKSISLERGRALVRMDIDDGVRVPVTTRAVIRPKTLFGEKFVDLEVGDDETTGPFLGDEERIRDTLGGFELEEVLAELHPILEAVDPEELGTVLRTLAAGGRGQGPTIAAALEDTAAVLRVQAAHDSDTRRFLRDLADLSDQLALSAGDIVGTASELGDVLPEVNARGDQVAVVLEQAGRLSADVADLLEANRPLLEHAVTDGGRALQILADRTARIPPLVTGLRQFLEVLASVATRPFGDGTTLANVKWVAGEESPCGRVPAGCGPPPGTPRSGAAAAAPEATTARPPAADLPAPVPAVDAVLSLVRGLSS